MTWQSVSELSGQPYGADVRDAMAAFTSEHPHERHGEVIYDLADTGLDPADVATRLAGYLDRFVAT